jgi:Ser-tRNA(Ala) deacylase AlaX
MSANSLPLYADDSHLTEFDATVVKAGPRFVVLDRTAFYPDSGGQPSDVGALRHAGGEAKVGKVVKGCDVPYLNTDIPTTLVHGAIDWPTRSWNMQRHSASTSSRLIEAGESPKIFSDLEKLEYQPSSLTAEQIAAVGRRFDYIVNEDAPVRVYFEDRAKIDASGDPRKISFLQKIPRSVDRLRIVDIGAYASTFCFGTHVKTRGSGCQTAPRGREEGKIVTSSSWHEITKRLCN